MRVIVTGERDWDDVDAVHSALDEELDEWRRSSDIEEFVVVHGACYPQERPDGTRPDISADWIAECWCRKNGIKSDPMPADWKNFGTGAGPHRNRGMAQRGGKRVRAFWSGKIERSGTLNAMSECAKRGIPIRVTTKAKR